MTDELCEYSLIVPPWLSWLLAVLGGILFLLAILRLLQVNFGLKISLLDKSAVIGNISPVLPLIIGLVFGIIGVTGLAANYHPPFARALGSKISFLVSREELPVAVDLTKEPVGELAKRFETDGRYSIRVTAAAGKVNLTGKFSGACDADLMNNVCRNAVRDLICRIDQKDKIFRVCARSEEVSCDDLTK
jgi:hypothetical protein